jgi:hypothetical protein
MNYEVGKGHGDLMNIKRGALQNLGTLLLIETVSGRNHVGIYE